MATSGSYDFNLTTSDIITESLERLGVLADGQPVSTNQKTNGTRTLNLLIKSLQNKGAKLWTREWEQVTLSASSVVTGSDSLAYKCVKSHTSSTATKPITGANFTSFWERTNDSSGGNWADTTSYNYIGDFLVPVKYIDVTEAFVRYNASASNTDYELMLKPIAEYLKITDKHTSGIGIPKHLYIERSLDLMTGFLYPTPDSNVVLNFLGTLKLEDMDADGNNPDFPSEWLETLVAGLTWKLASKYGLVESRISQFKSDYNDALLDSRKANRETSTRFIGSAYPEKRRFG